MSQQPTAAPTSRDHFVNASRVQLSRAMRRFARQTEAGALVLDAGAGRGPYRKLFRHTRYEAADFAQFSSRHTPLDYVCDLTAIPVEDGRFDAIVCNQVLEHLPEPQAALRELHRVLKPGGRMLLSVPLFYPEHQKPYDFYRYTQFGLRRLFTEAGLEITSLNWLEGYFGTVSYMLHQMYLDLPTGTRQIRHRAGGGVAGLRAAAVIALTRFAAQRARHFYARLDGQWKYTAKGMPKNHVVLARRPELAG